MTRLHRTATGLIALLSLPFALAACGGGIPGDSVAKVGDDPITKTQFNRYLVITTKGSSQTPGQPVTVPDPPDFKKCAAAKAQAQPKSSAAPKQATSVYVKQCRTEYKGLKEEALGQLIQADWVEGEAKEQGIEVSDKDVRKRFEQQKKSSFPKEQDFQKFLKQSGLTLNDILFRVRLDLLASKLRDKATKGQDKVTDQQVTAYYNSHKAQFATPERRDIRVVMTRNKAKAQAAAREINKGTSFKVVAKKDSIDPESKNNGGLKRGVVAGQQDARLDQAAFKATKGKVVGPIKGQFGYYVFRVEKITPKKQQALAGLKPSIRQQLIARNQQKALAKFVKDFRKRWTDKTDCRKGYVVQGCKGAPKPKTQSTPAPTPSG